MKTFQRRARSLGDVDRIDSPGAGTRRGGNLRGALTFVAAAGHHAGSPGTRWMHDNRATVFAKTAMAIKNS